MLDKKGTAKKKKKNQPATYIPFPFFEKHSALLPLGLQHSNLEVMSQSLTPK